MSSSIILVTFLIMVIVLLIMVIALFFRIKKLEEKTLDISAGDVATFAAQMREILVESERTAEQLDNSIRERESVLEDLGDLVDARISRLIGFTENDPDNKESTGAGGLYSRVYQLLLQGRTKQEIARLLNMSVAEVELISTLR